MGQALYRKYRPKSLGEVVGQEHIAGTLEKAIKSERISHAYLFTGPKGVGKTSVARILAHEINGLPYDDDSTHLDIIEIDAASNRRIDEIRELRDKVNIAPTSSKYKIYIIDEVHMLTREAFNALLKTLEEPPAHVVFILATTEAHKLPETIISRTQRFTFKPGAPEKVAAHLRYIADAEGIKISDEALALIAAHGEGSFRDSVSLLDQASARSQEVDAAYVQTMLGVPPAEAVDDLTAGLVQRDAARVVKALAQFRAQGYQPAKIAKLLGEAWRERLLTAGSGGADDFMLLQKLLDVPAAHEPARYLEIILLEFALTGGTDHAVESKTKGGDGEQPKPPKVDTLPHAPKPTASKTKMYDTAEPQAPPAEEKQPDSAPMAALDEQLWTRVLVELKKKHNTLYGVVRMASPEFVGADTIELGFRFAFHRKRVAEAKNQKIIAQVVKDLSGESAVITCVEASSSAEQSELEPSSSSTIPPAPAEAAPSPSIASISNIFGGGELLES